MRYFLENKDIKVEIDSFGAEVKSVLSKKENREYMWYGNPIFWGRTSPVLFPLVGTVKDKKYRHNDQEYAMGQHGFARDYEHTLLTQTKDEIWFSFDSNEETIKKYPFSFSLQIGYVLKKNVLKVVWRVINPVDSKLLFSIGAHPAFLCPIHGEENKNGYKLFFDGVDEIKYHGITSGGLSLREEKVLSLTDHCTDISSEFFDQGTYVVEGNQTKAVGIIDPMGNRYITVRFDTPLFGIWSPEGKNAPFFCIEPWFGRCDAVDFSGELKDREFGNVINGKGKFETSYEIEFA